MKDAFAKLYFHGALWPWESVICRYFKKPFHLIIIINTCKMNYLQGRRLKTYICRLFTSGFEKGVSEVIVFVILQSAKRANIKICQFNSRFAQSPLFRCMWFDSIPYSSRRDIHHYLFSFFRRFSYLVLLSTGCEAQGHRFESLSRYVFIWGFLVFGCFSFFCWWREGCIRWFFFLKNFICIHFTLFFSYIIVKRNYWTALLTLIMFIIISTVITIVIVTIVIMNITMCAAEALPNSNTLH